MLGAEHHVPPARPAGAVLGGSERRAERPERDDDTVHWDTGAVIGTGIGGMDTTGEKVVPLVNAGKTRRLGSTAVEQVMASGVSARVSGLLALGNQVTTNSSACSTGSEAVALGLERIRANGPTTGHSLAKSHKLAA